MQGFYESTHQYLLPGHHRGGLQGTVLVDVRVAICAAAAGLVAEVGWCCWVGVEGRRGNLGVVLVTALDGAAVHGIPRRVAVVAAYLCCCPRCSDLIGVPWGLPARHDVCWCCRKVMMRCEEAKCALGPSCLRLPLLMVSAASASATQTAAMPTLGPLGIYVGLRCAGWRGIRGAGCGGWGVTAVHHFFCCDSECINRKTASKPPSIA
jgi:hypothetical protein